MVSNPVEPLIILYDGRCPFCSRFVRLLRLRRAAGDVRLVDARQPAEFEPLVLCLAKRGYNLDEGMAIVRGNHVAYGDRCLTELALLSTPSNLFNRLNFWIFRSPARARLFYPVLRTARNATLKLMGVPKISNP